MSCNVLNLSYLKRAQPQNKSLPMWENTKELIINQKEIRMDKAGEDWKGL